MALPLKTLAVLALTVLTLSGPPAHSADTASPNDTARFLAGMQPSASSPLTPLTQDSAWQQHAQVMNSVWAGLDQNQLSKVRAWSRANLKARRPVTYYFFSGPDFLYADAFFPNSATYILAGLEPSGPLPDVLALRPRALGSDLDSVRTSISTLVGRSYFITSYMGSDLSASPLRGTLPVLYVFLARTGKTIHDVGFVTVAPDGTLVDGPSDDKDLARGVKIVFSGPDNKKQELYYFRTDLANKGVQASGFLEFCRKFGIGDVFIKAASYLLHTPAFASVRDFLLGQGATIVQDDTGVPLKYFEQHGWQVQPFGRYVGPIAVFRGNYQAKLKGLFEKAGAPPIDFVIGYRWRNNESHVLLAANPNPQVQPSAASRPEKPASDKAVPEKAAPEKSAASAPPSPAPVPPVALAEKAAPERSAPPPPAKAPAARPEPTAKAKNIPAPPPVVATEASRFVTSWSSLLFGGLFSAALVSVFGLEGLASVLGFLLQVAIIGAIAWGAMAYLRHREQHPALASAAASADGDATTRRPSTPPASQRPEDDTRTSLGPGGLAARLRRWTS